MAPPNYARNWIWRAAGAGSFFALRRVGTLLCPRGIHTTYMRLFPRREGPYSVYRGHAWAQKRAHPTSFLLLPLFIDNP
ncbi:MAG: hypothetical protein NVS3B11_16130 [Collimonas sp.]